MKKSDQKKYKKRKSKGKSKKSPIPLIVDSSTLIHYYLGSKSMIKYNDDFPTIFEYLDGFVSADEKAEDQAYLKALMARLEVWMEEKVKDQSLYDMIFWSRRIRPANIFKVTPHTVYTYRELTQLVYAKFCKGEDLIVLSNGMAMPKSWANLQGSRLMGIMNDEIVPSAAESRALQEISNILNLCYEIEALSYYYVYLMQRYRICCKGGWLIPSPRMGLDCDINPANGHLIELYDKRINHSNILAGAGGYASLQFPNDITRDHKSIMIAYQENLEEVPVKQLYQEFFERVREVRKTSYELFIPDDYISNYFPRPISIEDYYQYARMYSQEFLEIYGFSIEELLAFITGLSQENLSSLFIEPMRLDYMFKRGYTMYALDDIKQSYFKAIRRLKHNSNLSQSLNAEESFVRLFSFLSYDRSDASNIRLQTLGPRKIFYPLTIDKGIIDHTGWIGLLSYIMDPVCKNNDKKGDMFEDIVIQIIDNHYGKDSKWVVKRELKAGNRTREIDVAFVYQDVLFILECKAINLSWGFYSGDQKAIEFRNMKNKKAIEQADLTLAFITENFYQLNIAPPKGINYVASLLVSPHPEYIWEYDDNLLIDEWTPRILAAKELNLLNERLANKIKETPFCRRIPSP